MISDALRERIRQEADFACEFCGVSEIDVGGELTIDHYQPKTKGGSDQRENLLYSCMRCNQYKMDYWPSQPGDIPLWNPRKEPFVQHFLEIEDGALFPLTQTASFTISRLRLNRPQLVASRLRKREQATLAHLLLRYHELTDMLEQFQTYTLTMIEEQHALLKEQQRLLTILLKCGS